MALAHKVLVILYHVLREMKPYTDLGADYFDKLDASRIQRHHVRRLEQLGYTAMLTPQEVARGLTTRMMGDFHERGRRIPLRFIEG